MKTLCSLGLLFLLIATPAYSAQPNNDDALQNLTNVKAVFDVNQGDPKTLLLRLQLVEKTYQQLLDVGVTPEFVLAFRGGASLFLTTGDGYIEAEDKRTKAEVEQLLEGFKQHGIALEQCAIAAGLLKIGLDDFQPRVKVVANGYVSMIGYQNRGFALISME
ncbi:MAG: hypothetical protein C0622_10785 [Desulfuromonas sp.]|nr:MAG: hypothetical protein C0622_10785 [Desulfuromonas sp.]